MHGGRRSSGKTKAVRLFSLTKDGEKSGSKAQVQKWQKPASPPTWEQFTGDEDIAVGAAGLTDGQSIQPLAI